MISSVSNSKPDIRALKSAPRFQAAGYAAVMFRGPSCCHGGQKKHAEAKPAEPKTTQADKAPKGCPSKQATREAATQTDEICLSESSQAKPTKTESGCHASPKEKVSLWGQVKEWFRQFFRIIQEDLTALFVGKKRDDEPTTSSAEQAEQKAPVKSAESGCCH